MFGIGTSEILVILLIALLILGPKEIPTVARTIGRGLRQLERAKNEFRETIEFEAEKETRGEKSAPESEERTAEDGSPRSEDEAAEITDMPSGRV